MSSKNSEWRCEENRNDRAGRNGRLPASAAPRFRGQLPYSAVAGAAAAAPTTAAMMALPADRARSGGGAGFASSPVAAPGAPRHAVRPQPARLARRS
jgi:hypothetical protein